MRSLMARLNLTNPGIVTVDVHGMTAAEARKCIESKLKSSRGVYRIKVVHGYHGGTALRDMVRGQLAKNPKVIRVEIGLNDGETDLILKEF